MKQIHVAAAVIVNHDQILAGQRASGRLGEGAWERACYWGSSESLERFNQVVVIKP